MHCSAITTIAIGALLATANASADKRSDNNDVEKRASYYWSASQPGGNGGWPDFTHSMIIPSMSGAWDSVPSGSYAYPSMSAYPSADNSYYSSYYPSYSTVYYSSGGSTVLGGPNPTPRPGGNQNDGNPDGVQPQLEQASPNAGSSISTSGAVFLALGALTGVAAFLL